MFDKLKELWVKYWNWVMTLPDGPAILLTLLTVIVPIVIGVSGLIGVLDSRSKTKCLDSQLARRWSLTSRICEEYHDGEWVKANLSSGGIYYYNNAASQEH